MFQLDDKFLQDVGLGELPTEQKQAFLAHLYEELQLRVGTKLSEGLSEDQMAEFEAFADQNEDRVLAWFDENMPDYQSRQDFVQLQATAPEGTPPIAILSEYGSLKWLEINRPDYKSVVAAELEKLREEVKKNAPTILGQSDAGDSAEAA